VIYNQYRSSLGRIFHLLCVYKDIEIEKEKTFGSAAITTESDINPNEIKEDSKNIENFDNSVKNSISVDKNKVEINDDIIEKSENNKYIFNQEDTSRGKIFDDFSSLKNIDFKVKKEDEYIDGKEMDGQDLSQQDDRIARIREVALEGLQEYADKVDSEIYQFYKKIWLMCDKAVSEKDNSTVG